MGIPQLFSYINKNYPGVTAITRKTGVSELEPLGVAPCDHLYLDTNAMIHPCAQKVFNYGQEVRWLYPHANKTFEQKMDILYDTVCETVLEQIKNFRPKKSLMIAVDGVAPFAKQTQQRQRRYSAAKGREITSSKTFDPNCISPGTEFMFRLHVRLLALSQKIVKDYNIQVIYSSYMTPGEGEHKLLDRIRSFSGEEDKNDVHFVIGPDGDLLVLCLCLPVKNIYIAREDMNDHNLYNIVNIETLRTDLYRSFRTGFILTHSSAHKNRTKRGDYLRQFLFVCSIFGNDFLPRIQMFMCLPDGMNFIRHCWEKDLHVSRKRENFYDLIFPLFSVLERHELEFLEEQKSLCSGSLADPKFLNHTLLNSKDYNAYKVNYYQKAGVSTEEEIKNMCIDYIKSLIWVEKYYTKGIEFASWTWRYPYFYAPLMTDLKKYITPKVLSTLLETERNGVDEGPVDPFLQLLFVLPPQSSALLPVGFRKLFKNETNYPTSFDIDREGKRYEHEAVIKIKLPDTKYIEKRYQAIKKLLPEQYPRNKTKVQYTFGI